MPHPGYLAALAASWAFVWVTDAPPSAPAVYALQDYPESQWEATKAFNTTDPGTAAEEAPSPEQLHKAALGELIIVGICFVLLVVYSSATANDENNRDRDFACTQAEESQDEEDEDHPRYALRDRRALTPPQRLTY